MIFLWHHALWLTLALPAAVGAYVLLRRRRGGEAARYALVRAYTAASMPAGSLQAHVPALLLLAALSALLVSAARPVLVTLAPARQGTIVLLIDVSISMAASDVAPTRLAAALAAAKTLVAAQPPDVRIGVVAFGGQADVVQMPTADRKEVLEALERLELQRFTAIGNGLMAALLTLAPTAPIPRQYDIFGTGRPPPGARTIPLDTTQRAGLGPHKPARPGSLLSSAIILVSDGLGTMGVPAPQAAQMAADLGIRIYTVGVGTLYGGVAHIEGWDPVHADFDETALIQIADITRGEYFLARDADKVASIYGKLGRRVIFERAEREITVALSAIGVVLLIAAAGVSLARATR